MGHTRAHAEQANAGSARRTRWRLRQGERLLGIWAVLIALAWGSQARAQVCSEELRTLQGFLQQLRAEVVDDKPVAAVTLASTQTLEQPAGYDYENSAACRKWAIEVASLHRASCSFERAREQLKSIKTEQALAIDSLRAALERLSHGAASAPFSCKDRKDLYLICTPISDTAPDAWCARRVGTEDKLEFPRDAWCKLVDRDGVEVSTVNEGSEPTCREELAAHERSEKLRLRAERRASVATAGTGIALLAAIAIPFTYVPQGTAKLLRRLGALDKDRYDRLRHRSFRARQRVLPLLGVTALSLSSLSSRFWWAGLLTAASGVSADVLLAQHWHHPDKLRRGIGIAAACLGATGGLLLNLETLGYTDTSTGYSFMPTLRVGFAQAELGLAGRF
jgi:hypothetical protein